MSLNNPYFFSFYKVLNLLEVADETGDVKDMIIMCLPRLRIHIDEAVTLFDILAKVPFSIHI